MIIKPTIHFKNFATSEFSIVVALNIAIGIDGGKHIGWEKQSVNKVQTPLK